MTRAYLAISCSSPSRLSASGGVAETTTSASACAGCRAHLRQIEQVVSAAGRLREEDLAPGPLAALLEAFRGWKRGG